MPKPLTLIQRRALKALLCGFYMSERSDLISWYRKNQPIEELERKANKARSRKNKLWTQEALDLAARKGFNLLAWIAGEMGDNNFDT